MATIEFAYAMPIVFLMMFGLADVARVGRAHLRAQSAAIQIGQILSQCEQISVDDEPAVKDLAKRLLEPNGTADAPFALRITVFGRDSNNKAFTSWSINQTGGTATAEQSAPPLTGKNDAVPPGYIMGKNQVLFRIETSMSVDQSLLTRGVSLLTRNTATSTAIPASFTEAKGSAVLSTRAANTDDLDTKNPKGGKGCLT